MNRLIWKKYIILGFALTMCMCLLACGKKKDIELKNGLFVSYSFTPKDLDAGYKTYTTHVDVYVGGTVIIYADAFDRLYIEGEIPEKEVVVRAKYIDELKKLIEEQALDELPELIGSRDNIAGIHKELTIHYKDYSHTTGGISPTNANFNKVCDYISGMVQEELFEYSATIEEAQRAGYEESLLKGLRLESYDGGLIMAPTDVVEVKTSGGFDGYRVIIEVNEETGKRINESFRQSDAISPTYNLFVDGDFYCVISLHEEIYENLLYLNTLYTQEQAEDVVAKLQEALDKNK